MIVGGKSVVNVFCSPDQMQRANWKRESQINAWKYPKHYYFSRKRIICRLLQNQVVMRGLLWRRTATSACYKERRTSSSAERSIHEDNASALSSALTPLQQGHAELAPLKSDVHSCCSKGRVSRWEVIYFCFKQHSRFLYTTSPFILCIFKCLYKRSTKSRNKYS